MARNRSKVKIIEELKVEKYGSEGMAIAYHDEKVIFIPFAAPGDIVDVRVIKRKRKYLEGKILKFHHHSELRRVAFCKHFGTCGGCKWQHIPYEEQLKLKQDSAEQNLIRLGGLEVEAFLPIVGSDEEKLYRNKLEFSFCNRKWLLEEEMDTEETQNMNGLGFHIPRMFDRILDIDTCYLMDEKADEVRNSVRTFCFEHGFSFYDQRGHEGELRSLVLRKTHDGQWMLILVFGYCEDDRQELILNFIKEKFAYLNSVIRIVNQKKNDSFTDLDYTVYSGNDHLEEEMDGLKFKIRPLSFFQTNYDQALKLYRTVRDFAELKGDENVYDLYTGTGTIANYLAPHARMVIGIEYVEMAVQDAKENSGLNKIGNTRFFAGDMVDVFSPEFVEEHGRPDVLITDPPRAGMHAKVVERIMQNEPVRIVYVSCNPATQARDLALLSEKYDIKKSMPFDMFPQTHHVENIVQLELKQTTL